MFDNFHVYTFYFFVRFILRQLKNFLPILALLVYIVNFCILILFSVTLPFINSNILSVDYFGVSFHTIMLYGYFLLFVPFKNFNFFFFIAVARSYHGIEQYILVFIPVSREAFRYFIIQDDTCCNIFGRCSWGSFILLVVC